MLFNSPAITSVKNAKTEHQLAAVQGRITEINSKLSKVTNTAPVHAPKHDWAASYQNWAAYEDTEELEQNIAKEEAKMKAIIDKTDNLGHYHDHSKERQFFEKSENEKFIACEDNRLMGNYLFGEGMYTKAAEHYQIAIAYYEYCFPEDQSTQSKLDDLRRACLCNISLCYLRLGYLRQAVESASIVLKETGGVHSKALFRRAQAYRELDEYELAVADLKNACELSPGDPSLANELAAIKSLRLSYVRNNRDFAEAMLGVGAAKNENASGIFDEYIHHTHLGSHHSNSEEEEETEACCRAEIPLEPVCTPAVSSLCLKCIGLVDTNSPS